MTHPEIVRFLEDLRARLGERGSEVERILAETEDHLLQSVEWLAAEGFAEEAAVREALARFGAPEEIVRAFAQQVPGLAGPFGRAHPPVARLGLALLAVFNGLAALFVAGHTLLVREGLPLWNAIKIAACAFVVAVGALTLGGAAGRSREWAIAGRIGAAGLCALGTAGALWTVRLGRTTGDLEMWAVVLNLLVTGQGLATLVLHGPRVRRIPGWIAGLAVLALPGQVRSQELNEVDACVERRMSLYDLPSLGFAKDGEVVLPRG